VGVKERMEKFHFDKEGNSEVACVAVDFEGIVDR
jgi:hypothetical protein